MARNASQTSATERQSGTGIRVTGASENNLADLSLDLPKNAIVAFVGVSGSGKSSLVFDTIAVEAQRQLNATFPWFIRNQLPKYDRPDVTAIENLTTPVVVDQNPLGGNARSTVGTITEIYSMLRAMFAAHAEPSLGHPAFYSFNDPSGMCPDCDGLGRTLRPDPGLMLDTTKSLNEGAILLPGFPVGGPALKYFTHYDKLDADKKLSDFTPEETEILLHGDEGTVEIPLKSGKISRLKYEGLVSMFTRRNLKGDDSARSEKARAAAERFISEGACDTCHGARLTQAALASLIDGKNIADWSAVQVIDLIALLTDLEANETLRPHADAIRDALTPIDAIGLGYLSLDRATSTLSGGEGQRLKLVKHLGSDLTELTYIFDEPSVGLHPRDVSRLNDLLRALREKSNTVLVVEHDPDVIAIADHVVEIGPGSGSAGGELVFQGSLDELRAEDTATAQGLRRVGQLKRTYRKATGAQSLTGVTRHNLKNISVDVPTGVLTVVTGVAGSGKSSLITGAFLDACPDAIFVDQSPIATSSRSNPATFIGAMDPIRKLFAKTNGVDASLFSFNSKGACEQCQGRGVLITELSYMDPVTSRCDSCDGRRFKEDVLEHRLRDKTIADVLAMSAEQAAAFFTEKPIQKKLAALVETGVGYLGLGQSLSTLSGGERQRVKLADQLSGKGNVYVLDEPTTGLHMADVDTLLALLNGIVDAGNTVVVIEHNLAVIEQADWIIDLGPDGGKNGGEIVFTGTPEKLLAAESSATGEYLAQYQEGRK